MRTDNKAAWDALTIARYRQNYYASRRRNNTKEFDVGDQVMYERRTRAKGRVKKLQTIWMGPYIITHIDKETGNCTLQLPRNAKAHNVFATDKLKKYYSPNTYRPIPTIEEDLEQLEDVSNEDITEYEVEKILGQKTDNGIDYWLVKWKGYDHDSNTWEPNHHVANTAPQAIADYLQSGHSLVHPHMEESNNIDVPMEYLYPETNRQD